MSAGLPWLQRTTEIPEGGLHARVTASDTERSAVAKQLGLISCEAVDADCTIRALGAGRYRLVGTLRARLTQACVATLEPVRQEIEEEFDVQFWPAASLPETGETEVEVSSIPEVEPIEHGMLDVGRVVFEVLSAGLDPYPRKSGANLEWQDPEGSEAGASPFAGLKKLKDQA